MAREKEGYRDTLAELNRIFPEKNLLSLPDVVRYTGLDRRTVMARYGKKFTGEKYKSKFINKTDLARAVCG